MGTLDQHSRVDASTASTASVASCPRRTERSLSMDSMAILPEDVETPESPASPVSAEDKEDKEDKAASPPSPATESQIEPLPEQDGDADTEAAELELEQLKQSQLRKSTGSILARQQEALDHRRHTFSAVTAGGRANARRRSYDFALFSGTYPPVLTSASPPVPAPQGSKTHHLQHLRVYGKISDPARHVSERHEEGAAMLAVRSPASSTTWTRGRAVQIEWEVLDSSVKTLRIELMEDGLSATTLIAAEAPNTGAFTYHRVPWGMESGSKYFLRISAAAEPARSLTTSFFQISSAP